MIIPSPTHIHNFKDFKEISCLWKKEGKKIIYEKIKYYKNKKKIIINPKNPYRLFNEYILDFFSTFKFKNKKFYVALKFHPKLDEPIYFEECLKNPLVKSIKIHGLATHCGPEDIPNWIVNLSKKYDKPFFIHTDYFNPENKVDHIREDMYEIMEKNDSRKWFDWVIKKGVRAFLAHGARLDLEVIKGVNNSKKIVLGIGPESKMNLEKKRLKIDVKNYLEKIIDLVDPEKLIYCSDFRWNLKEIGNDIDLEWETPNKIQNICKKKGFSDEKIQAILMGNATTFFNCN